MACRLLGRRANGEGEVVLMTGLTLQEALDSLPVAYEADHSLTMVWALDSRGSLVGEPLLRMPPGLPEDDD